MTAMLQPQFQPHRLRPGPAPRLERIFIGELARSVIPEQLIGLASCDPRLVVIVRWDPSDPEAVENRVLDLVEAGISVALQVSSAHARELLLDLGEMGPPCSLARCLSVCATLLMAGLDPPASEREARAYQIAGHRLALATVICPPGAAETLPTAVLASPGTLRLSLKPEHLRATARHFGSGYRIPVIEIRADRDVIRGMPQLLADRRITRWWMIASAPAPLSAQDLAKLLAVC